jgi:hypothetical protein
MRDDSGCLRGSVSAAPPAVFEPVGALVFERAVVVVLPLRAPSSRRLSVRDGSRCAALLPLGDAAAGDAAVGMLCNCVFCSCVYTSPSLSLSLSLSSLSIPVLSIIALHLNDGRDKADLKLASRLAADAWRAHEVCIVIAIVFCLSLSKLVSSIRVRFLLRLKRNVTEIDCLNDR